MDILLIAEKFSKRNHKKKYSEADLSKRNFIKTIVGFTALATLGFVSVRGAIESFNLTIKKVLIKLPLSHANLQGLSIVQISDVHLGPTLKKDFINEIINKTNSLDADLIVITGDLVDGSVRYLKNELNLFSQLKSKQGVYYITGNHEYYWNAEEWIQWAKEIGFNVLLNENVNLNYNGISFSLAGVTDLSTRKFNENNPCDLKKASEKLVPNQYKILLSHQPKLAPEAAEYGYHLQLSGHTHGGQGYPWNFVVKLFQPYINGLYNIGKMQLYVTQGAGFWGPPNRFLLPPQIDHIIFQA
jgi:predicted MPP superfamily phosphohydrolase